MKNYLPKNLSLLKKKILNEIKYLKNTEFNYKIIIKELVFLNLKMENLLFDRSNKKGNPVKIVTKDLINLYVKINNLKEFSDFEKKINLKKNKFIRESSHKVLFDKLWTNFNFIEYKKERLGRYIKRIKINNLENKIKNKSIVDFGCGHGNFLISCLSFGAKKCIGIDYGKNSIKYAKLLSKKMKVDKKIDFYVRSVYNSQLKNNSFDFAIQNGVFHHLNNEIKAYKEMYRVLKPGGYCWIYTDGGGGIRDYIGDLSQEILRDINKNFVIKIVRSMGLTTNKEYHLSDTLNALYRHTNLHNLKKKLSSIGFKFVRQLKGGFRTDFEKPFIKDKYFNQKFGSGDLRLLLKK